MSFLAPLLVGVAVMLSSALFIDARSWLRPLGYALLVGGAALVLITMAVTLIGESEKAAQCRSRGGVPESGKCWIDGEAK